MVEQQVQGQREGYDNKNTGNDCSPERWCIASENREQLLGQFHCHPFSQPPLTGLLRLCSLSNEICSRVWFTEDHNSQPLSQTGALLLLSSLAVPRIQLFHLILWSFSRESDLSWSEPQCRRDQRKPTTGRARLPPQSIRESHQSIRTNWSTRKNKKKQALPA